jgi:hypothetical protein
MSDDSTPDVIVSQAKFSFPTRQQRPAVTVDFSDDPEPYPQDVQAGSRPTPPAAFVAKKPIAGTDADLLSVPLPSGFRFYPFKTLSIRGVRGKHQAKFAQAYRSDSTRIVVETVSSLVAEDIDAADLTVQDFFFVLYQLRLNCMGNKVPMIVRSMCSDPEHVLAVTEGKLPKETLRNETHVVNSSLKSTDLDQEALDLFLESPDCIELKTTLSELGFDLAAPTMRTSIELEEEFVGKPGLETAEFFADLAGCLQATRNSEDGQLPPNLAARIKIVEELSASDIHTLRSWVDLMQSYGVEETVKTLCKGCRAEIETEVSVSAHSFL